MFAKHDNKVFECTKYTEKEVTLPCDEEVTKDSVTVVDGLNTKIVKKKRSPEPLPRIDPIALGNFTPA
jgi:plastocyanin domain-containing protein